MSESLRNVATQGSGIKHDENKAMFGLIPPRALLDVAHVFTKGAIKYSPRNWEKGLHWSRMYNAAQRHLWAFWGREDLDPETGESHIAHAICNLLMLLSTTKSRKDLDDRGGGND